MARAKRTDRTEARRRYRSDQAAPADDERGSGRSEASRPGTAPVASGPQVARPSIRGAFRGASRPLDLRGDLRAWRLVFLNIGFLVAIAATVVGVILFVGAYNDAAAAIPAGLTGEDLQTRLTAIYSANSLPYFVGTMVLQPPPAIGAFLIGFTAKRASWLGGLLYGVFATLMAAIVLQTPAGLLLRLDNPADAVLFSYASFSPLGAMLFASAAAWYRRFLDLANPNRQGQRQRQQRSPQGRGDMKPARR